MKQENGVYQQENGYWAYRFSIVVNGDRIIRRRARDEQGQPFKTKRAAAKARTAAIAMEQRKPTHEAAIQKKTVSEVYREYCEKGRSGKAYSTIRKQDSLWKNHIRDKFGPRYVGEISAGEIEDYLTELYCKEGRAYRYVEAFLKMFYLIFGQAYSRNYLDMDTYSKLCLNKGTKIHMPKKKTDEDDEIIAFSKEALEKLDGYFRGTNAETAYLLGRYCGLRINECYGLKWCNVDLSAGTILIDRQMQYQDGLIKLVPLKTRNAKRTIYMSEKLKVYFQKLSESRAAAEEALGAVRQQNQTLLTDLDGNTVSSLELVNSLPNGKIQTVNSMKYHSRTIKEKLGIGFKYHYLRHTYGTFMADHNTPAHLLCNQMGHASIQVTQKYYIAMSKEGVEILKGNLESL
ncbi:MAG: tyrosine-type recombinase/integrase [Faecousia sp.]